MQAVAIPDGLRAVALGLCVVATGCPVCNDSVCSSRLGVTVFEHDGAALQPGTWVLSVTSEGADPISGTCEIGPGSRSADCGGELNVTPVIFDDPDNPFTVLRFSFEGGNGLGGLPQSLDIEIAQDGTIVHDQSYEPDYTLTEPEHCDPDCFSDSIEIIISRD